MKNALLAATVMMFGLSAFAAAPPTTPAAPSEAPAASVPATGAPAASEATAPVAAPEHAKKGAGKWKEAKEECQKENPSLKGKELRKCIKGKAK